MYVLLARTLMTECDKRKETNENERQSEKLGGRRHKKDVVVDLN